MSTEGRVSVPNTVVWEAMMTPVSGTGKLNAAMAEAEISVIEGARISCQAVAPDRRTLYVLVAPEDRQKGDPAFFSIHFEVTPAAAGTSMQTSSNQQGVK